MTEVLKRAGAVWRAACVAFVFVCASVQAQTATTTTLSSSANPASTGQSVTLTANVSGSSPTGTVTLTSDPNHSKRMALLHFEGAPGAATITGSEATPKTWTVVGNAQLAASGGASVLTLDGSGDYLTTTSNLSDFVFGTGDFEIRFRMKTSTANKVVLDFYAYPAVGWELYINPSGKMEWYDSVLSKTGAITVSDGAWHDIEITRVAGVLYFYVDGTRDGAGTSYSKNLNAQNGQLAIGTQLLGRTNTTYDFNGQIDEVRISKGVGGNTGSTRVVASDGTVALASAALSGGAAALGTSALSAGQHWIWASYAGDANNAPSVSATLVQSVATQAGAALAMTPSPASLGQAVTLTATITGTSPTGTVTFKNGSTTLSAVALNAGIAKHVIGSMPAGNHSFTAVYGGDASNIGATSSAITQSVASAQSTTTLTVSPGTASLGQNVTLSARVQGYNPAGTVTFTDGATTLGTAAVVSGQASFSVTSLALGSHSLAAAYAGDSYNGASSSAASSLTVGARAAMTWQYGYDAMGRPNTVVDGNALASYTYYDGLGRPIQTQQPANTGASSPTVTQLGYDLVDGLTSVADPRNLSTTYTRNGLGTASALSSPDTGGSSYTYDAKGNLLTATDARGKQTSYVYDNLDRVVSISYPTGTTTTFEYDGGSSPTAAAKGELTKITDGSGQTTYGHDAFGRITSKTVTIGSKTFTVGYSWGSSGSALDKLTAITYPSGSRVNYSYDSYGSFSGITVNPVNANGVGTSGTATTLLSSVTYNAEGKVTGWQWSGGKARTIGYDANGLVASYTLGDPTGTGTAAGVLRALSRDSAGRITGYSHTNSGSAVSSLDQGFTYDNLDRLLTATVAGVGTAYSYDANGNRTSKTIGGTTYSNTIAGTSNRMTQAADVGGTASISHDAAGHVTGDGTNTFTYNDRGRMVTASNAGGTVTYVYSGLELRVGKSGPTGLVPTGAGYYVFDEQGQLLGEYDANGAPVYETIYLGSTPVGAVKQTGTAAGNDIAVTLYNAYADHIDTARLITRQDHAIVWRWDSAEAFGATAANQNPSSLGTFTYNPRFPGQVFDAETGLFQNWHREYNARWGRYVQSDPIGLAGGVNTFAYARAQPTSLSDGLGLYTEITRWATDRSGHGAWGHMTANVNDQNFSWTGKGWDTQYPSAADYNKHQTDDVNRDGKGIILDLTPLEEAKFAACLRSKSSGAYHAITNNCGNPLLSCLEALGIVDSTNKRRVLPADVLDIIAGSPRARGQTSHAQPGNSSFDTPQLWILIDAARRRWGF